MSDVFTFKQFNKEVSIPISGIMFFEATEKNDRITVFSSNSMYGFFSNLETIEKSLGERFSRCHPLYLVNADQIKEIEEVNSLMVLKDGGKCPVSQSELNRLLKS